MQNNDLNQNEKPVGQESFNATPAPNPALHNLKFQYQLTLSGPDGAVVDIRGNSDIPMALHPLFYIAGRNCCEAMFNGVISTAFNAATAHFFHERQMAFYAKRDEEKATPEQDEKMPDAKTLEAFKKSNSELMKRLGMLPGQQPDREEIERIERSDRRFRNLMKLKISQADFASQQPTCAEGDEGMRLPPTITTSKGSKEKKTDPADLGGQANGLEEAA